MTMYLSPKSATEATSRASGRSGFFRSTEGFAARQQGFSLIELMVGIVISLICTLAIMAAFSVFEGQKRTTSSADDAQQSGSYALYSLERQIRTAGSGLVQGNRYGVWGCPITAYTSSTKRLPLAAPAPFTAWPSTTRAVAVLVSSGGKDASNHVLPDIIGVVSGDPAARVFKAAVSSTPSATSVVLTNSFGILQGDYLLGTLADGTCALALTTSAPDASNTINLSSANSPATGLQTAANVMDMGADPVVSLYGVNTTNNSLVTFDLLQRAVNGQAAAVTPIADGVIMVKALYGIHNGSGTGGTGNDSVDAWVQPTTGTAWGIDQINASTTTAYNAMNQIKAVRVAIVAESRISERSTDYASGKTSLTLFTDLPVADQYVITTDPHYRYKVYDTTIPVRNAFIDKYF